MFFVMAFVTFCLFALPRKIESCVNNNCTKIRQNLALNHNYGSYTSYHL